MDDKLKALSNILDYDTIIKMRKLIQPFYFYHQLSNATAETKMNRENMQFGIYLKSNSDSRPGVVVSIVGLSNNPPPFPGPAADTALGMPRAI